MSKCCSGGCACDDATAGKKTCTEYENRDCEHDPSKWVIKSPGKVCGIVVPAASQFITNANLPWTDKKLCGADCVKVEVQTGTVKFLGEPMGPNGAKDLGTAAKQAVFKSGEVARASWYSPDGATVCITLYRG